MKERRNNETRKIMDEPLLCADDPHCMHVSPGSLSCGIVLMPCNIPVLFELLCWSVEHHECSFVSLSVDN